MRMKLILLLLFLGLIFFPLALAEQIVYTTEECGLVPEANLPPVTGSNIPLRQVTYTQTINLPKFDPGLGLLTGVHLTVDACGKQDFSIDNEDPGDGPFIFDISHSGLIRVTVPLPIPEIVDVVITNTTTIELPTDSDGIPDFVGDDSYSNTIEDCSDAPADKVYTQPSDLAVFTASSSGSTEFV
ncbi:MAG: choice-of-anchor E domain-containing protein, partial [Bacteroidales bacterium]|nr:choice-of-anchor E domain-containing protein [Bacteroidales bacterium]